MSVAIRQIGPEDAPAYRAVRLEALAGDPRAFASDLASERDKPLEWYAQGAAQCAVFLAFGDKAEPVGMAGFVASNAKKSAHIGHVFGVFVSPGQRGAGVGDGLVSAVIEHARQTVRQIHLGVGAYNVRAMALYHRHGFEIYGTEPRSLFVDGDYIDEHLMVRFLD